MKHTPKGQKILIEFGKKVKLERENLGLSQEKLAEKAGVHRTYIGMIERAEKNISLLSIQKLSNALGISLRELFREIQ